MASISVVVSTVVKAAVTESDKVHQEAIEYSRKLKPLLREESRRWEGIDRAMDKAYTAAERDAEERLKLWNKDTPFPKSPDIGDIHQYAKHVDAVGGIEKSHPLHRFRMAYAVWNGKKWEMPFDTRDDVRDRIRQLKGTKSVGVTVTLPNGQKMKLVKGKYIIS